MVECLFVPHATSIEHEHLLTLGVSEDQVFVEHHDVPEQSALYMACVHLLERRDVHEVALY